MVTLKWTDEKGDKHQLEYNGPVPVGGEKIQMYDFNSKYIGALQAAEQLWQLREQPEPKNIHALDEDYRNQWNMDVTVNCIWIPE